MAADPEKAPDARPASDKRPASTRSRSRSSSGSSSGSEHGNQDVEKAQPRPRPADEEGNDGISEHRNDLVPAATVGEPSGEGIYACESGCPPCRTRSCSRSRGASSTRRVPVVVPRARRRGLLGRFGVIPEVERPYDYRNRTKWAITAAVSFASAGAPMGSSIFYPALPQLSADFGAGKTVTNLSVALYMLAMAIFPLWWSSFSEQLGRRTIYLASFGLFCVFSVLCAVSKNMAMLIVFRTCSGAASASVQAVGAGTIADIWESYERGRAMSIFYLGPLLGPLVAPILGGVLAQELGWQATMWFLAIYGFVCLVVLVCFLPETLAATKQHTAQAPGDQEAGLSRMSTAQSAKKAASTLRRFLVDPLAVLLFLRFPPVALTVTIGAIAFGSLYISSITIQRTYDLPPYSFSQIIIGLLYAPPGLGYITASLFGGAWIDKIMAREARKANRYDEAGRLILLPEDRMRENLWIANSVYPLALVVFGWTLRYGVHWIVPSIALYFFGVSSMLVFSSVTTMLTEFVRKRSSAGVAVNNFVRNILSAIGLVVASRWTDAVGTGWVFTTLAIACLVIGFSGIILLRKNAAKWRIEMEKVL